jgi:hypothetical protein
MPKETYKIWCDWFDETQDKMFVEIIIDYSHPNIVERIEKTVRKVLKYPDYANDIAFTYILNSFLRFIAEEFCVNIIQKRDLKQCLKHFYEEYGFKLDSSDGVTLCNFSTIELPSRMDFEVVIKDCEASSYIGDDLADVMNNVYYPDGD